MDYGAKWRTAELQMAVSKREHLSDVRKARNYVQHNEPVEQHQTVIGLEQTLRQAVRDKSWPSRRQAVEAGMMTGGWKEFQTNRKTQLLASRAAEKSASSPSLPAGGDSLMADLLRPVGAPKAASAPVWPAVPSTPQREEVIEDRRRYVAAPHGVGYVSPAGTHASASTLQRMQEADGVTLHHTFPKRAAGVNGHVVWNPFEPYGSTIVGKDPTGHGIDTMEKGMKGGQTQWANGAQGGLRR